MLGSNNHNLFKWFKSTVFWKMARFNNLAKKLRLAKKGRQSRWAPFWIIPKIYGQGRRVHPSRHTHIKRSWRRNKTKA